MPLTAKGEKIKSAMQEQYGEEKGTSVFYASRNKGTIEGVDQMPQMPTTPPNSSIPSSPTGAMGTTSPPVTGDDTTHAEGPKGVVKPVAGLPEDNIKLNNPGGPSGTPDAEGEKESDWPPIPKKPILGSTAPKAGRIKTAYGWAGKDEGGRRKLANDRPPDKAVGTLRDYAAAAGAKRPERP
jgi:hypothetical protein